MNPLFASLPTTIFEEMSALARRMGAVNLGQGFPDAEGPLDVRSHACAAIMHGNNQYPPMLGTPPLREAIADHYRQRYGLDYDPERGVVVTAGATEGIAASILALIAPGDEVVLFQPMFDVYLPLVLQAGGIPRYVNLIPPAWRIDEAALASAFSPKTRLVIFNAPHNPTASIFTRADLELLADYCRRYDAIALCDEVWEHHVFDGLHHNPLATLPGMAERCVKLGSGGKIFSLTGWKVGWACASPALCAVIAKAHQFLTFTVNPAMQSAVAYGLGKDVSYFTGMRSDFVAARDHLAAGLSHSGYCVLPSQGTYFLNVDLAASGVSMDDRAFCLRAVQEAGVAAIPVSAFYAQAPETHIVRLCFAKRRETLDAGVDRLGAALRLMR